MVGFPGETEADFTELYNSVRDLKFERLGAFSYSKEDGTPAERLSCHIHYMTKRKRYNQIMKLQQGIANELMKKEVGKKYEVLIESKTFDGKFYIGRSKNEIPEIDGAIFIPAEEEDLLHKFVNVEITEARGYDLVGKMI